MEEKIIKTLIELYREQGLDVTQLTNDPIFTSLSMSTRLQLIKDYASELSANRSTGFTKEDIKRVLRDAAIGAGMGAVGGFFGAGHAAAYIKDPEPSTVFRPMLTSTLVGGGLGGAVSGLRSIIYAQSRQKVNDQLTKLKNDPSDENAIKFLSLRHMQPQAPSRTHLLNSLFSKYDNKYIEHITKANIIAGKAVFEENKDKPLMDSPLSEKVKKLYSK